MKDSGVEWIGEIPEHWKISKISKVVTKITNGFVGPTRDILVEEGTPYLQSLHVKNGKIKFKKKYFVSDSWSKNHSKSILREGDVVVVQTGGIGECAAVTKEFEGSNCHALIIVQLKQDLGIGFFLSYLLRSNYGLNTIISLKTGALHPHLEIGNFKDVFIPLPPLKEQKTIVNFLDRETAKINLQIEKNQKIIELLLSKKKVLINQLVTKGLEKSVSMKDSGIEWIGEIPESWEISPLKFLVNKIGSGITPKGGSESYKESGIPLIRSQNVHFEGLRLDDVAFINEHTHKQMNGTHLKEFDVLLNITGASIGRCTFVPKNFGEGNVNQHVCIIRPNENLHYSYLLNFLQSPTIQDWINAVQVGASRQGLTLEEINSLLITIPSIEEQKKISSYLGQETSKIDNIIMNTEKQNIRLHEFNRSLINSSTLGKIDVTGLA